ncbi:hypothetical protein HMPREF1624_00453 [Sporothrix schenckii ATCC 58251]|uniref:Zn(2)-C6 fungal-type domain-containing protein n=1 Tax=Sporothrix schenckii (strain ATCC 58251 / de Perez 2211183) TaxID=1391915 RepID=U7Q554_SPOS1|nr:hypothetical protein HMPREF1624_00453 [Sporothrix schenckii ATCC 58251]
MVGGAASALGSLRPQAPGASTTSPTTGNNNSQASPSSTSTSILPPLSSMDSSAAAAAPSTASRLQQPSYPNPAEGYSPATTDSPSLSPSDEDGEDGDGEGDGDEDADAQAEGDRNANGSGGTQAARGTSHLPAVSRPGNAQQSQSHAAGTSAGGAGGGNAADAKKPRACEACRGLKVRCDMDPNAPPETPCRRCAKAGRQCIVTQPTRRRQKKTDSRVAELEKKIDALTASLQMTRQTGPGPAGTGTSGSGRDDGGNSGNGRMSISTSGGNGILREWPPHLDPPQLPPVGPRSTSTTSIGGVSGRDLPPIHGLSGPAPPHSPYSTSTVGRSPFSNGPPPMVMAGQKRKFSEIREATGVVGAGGNGPGSRGGSGSRAGSTASDESPSMRENPYQSYHTHHSLGHNPPHGHASQHAPPSQRHNVQEPRHPPPQPQTSPAYGMARSPAGGVGGTSRFGTEYADIIDRGLLTMEKAVELFQRYTDQMARHMPAVVFPPGTTAADIRKTKPVLFLSIMAASTTEMSDIQRAIVKELMQIFAEKVFVVGEKSLELVQALQVAVIWYWPPEHFEELKFYQLVHTAAVMAIEIGLGKRRPGNGPGGASGGRGAGGGVVGGGPGSGFASASILRNGFRSAPGPRIGPPFGGWRDHPFKKYPLPDPCSIEGRRTWLACYFMTSNTAMALHRPNLVRWTSFMTECVEVLESSPDAAPSDKYLCHLVWTHRMAEEVGQQFSMDDPATVINIADPRTQYALRGFERELERYKSTIPRNLLQPSLRLSFEVLSLYMHEIALQTENGNDDFKTPYTAESTKEALIGDATLTPAHIRALTACLLAIDGIFDAFLGMDIQSLRCIPIFNFVRVAYATVVMIKLYLFASSPNSELGKVINKEHMKVEQHLNALLDKFRATAAGNRSRPAGKFMIVLAMIRSWFLKQQAHNPFEAREGGAGQQENGESSSSQGAADQEQSQPPPQPQQDHVASPAAAGTPGGSASQSYMPSSAFLSTINNNTNSSTGTSNGNHLRAASTSSATATPSPSVTSGTTPNANNIGINNNNNSSQVQQQPQPQPQTQHQMQAPSGMYSSANTPLQLLSEIAANDYAANAATTAAASGMSQQQQQGAGPAAAVNTIPPWPPFYSSLSNGAHNGNAATTGAGTGNSGQTSDPQQQQQQVSSLMPPPPSTADYMAQYPDLNLGDNFEYAVDLTLVGLSDGADNMNLSDGLNYILADPWFGGGEAFQF